MFDISIPVAFWAGLISFFAPCALPLFPAYLAYVTGESIQSVKQTKKITLDSKILAKSIFYVLGFSLTFVILGSSFAGLGILLRKNADHVRILGGALMIFFGMQSAGFINLPFLAKGGTVAISDKTSRLGLIRPFLIGFIFATTWVPCIGPILGSILALSLIQTTAIKGAMLLFVYSLGISLPFLIASFAVSSFSGYFKRLGPKIATVSKVSGFLMIILGLMLIFNKLVIINAFIGKIF